MTEYNEITKAEHYNKHPAGIECIDIVKHYNFCIGNVIKYVWRSGLKGQDSTIREDELKDLKKAKYYLEKEIEEKEKLLNNKTLLSKKNFDVTLSTNLKLNLIWCKPGTFQMGSPENQVGRLFDEPLHRVNLTQGFYLAETQVTQLQWENVMGTRPWQGKAYTIEGDDVAATYVSWNGAMAFCRKLTEREQGAGRLPEGLIFRLPTEAEWEYACRAGTRTRFSFGDSENELQNYAVYASARNGEYAHAVKTKLPNPWGFYDMHGNVWEWCLDAAKCQTGVVNSTYRDGISDPCESNGPQRVCRGGGWDGSAQYCRSAYRYANDPAFVGYYLGFRPVLTSKY